MDTENTILSKIIAFGQQIGVPIRFGDINVDTFLPGLYIDKGTLIIDKLQLKYIGDILHEMGHIALMNREQRNTLFGSLEGQLDPEASEMATIAWSYAAALEIGIDPEVVFHADGYKGESENILSNFNQGHYFGVPILQWYGLTFERVTENKNIVFPKMIRWTRD